MQRCLQRSVKPIVKAMNRSFSNLSNVDLSKATVLPSDSNQALGIANYAIDFVNGERGSGPDASVHRRVELFHTDSVVCGLSALALGTNAPTILRDEALRYRTSNGATVFGSAESVHPEKAIAANASAVREWDSNGTVFGYNKSLGHIAGEFGHNDFYPVIVAAAQVRGDIDGATASRAMIALDEIRGRLAEVFSLKTYKIDHVVHGAIASAAVYGALLGATASQIESAIGMVVAHYVPWRAIRAGKQLSDSKGASAAISTEVAILSMRRAMKGFVGPADIFRNPESLFRQFEPTADGESPFNLVLSHSGDDFAVMGMHFKLGLYEHQSAGALQGAINMMSENPHLAEDNGANIDKIKIVCYEPAYGIIGDPAKRHPTTRQSADHSMVYIVSRKLQNGFSLGPDTLSKLSGDDLWKQLILLPADYDVSEVTNNQLTRSIMDKIEFEHGGPEYDERYPDGIPTSVVVTDKAGKSFSSGMVMYPAGHARNTDADLEGILDNKFRRLGELAVEDPDALVAGLSGLTDMSAEQVKTMYNVPIKYSDTPMQ
jgi:2-methylcitrate dehydratase